MFDQVKRFFREFANEGEEPFGESDYRLAVAALLVHVADADGVTSPQERDRLRQVLGEQFDLDRSATSRLLDLAARSDEEAVDLFHFTSLLKRRLDDEGRRMVVGLMWDVVYADQIVHELEDSVVFRVAELLGVSTNDRVALRQRAVTRAGIGSRDESATKPVS